MMDDVYILDHHNKKRVQSLVAFTNRETALMEAKKQNNLLTDVSIEWFEVRSLPLITDDDSPKDVYKQLLEDI